MLCITLACPQARQKREHNGNSGRSPEDITIPILMSFYEAAIRLKSSTNRLLIFARKINDCLATANSAQFCRICITCPQTYSQTNLMSINLFFPLLFDQLSQSHFLWSSFLEEIRISIHSKFSPYYTAYTNRLMISSKKDSVFPLPI
ncbi:hypothetical protein DdX_19629 [Ditylenchus destructor]|uniref:Uncharacterized protein n=1 Tax=Ditylenchus destructor TaxID=166010 RepID=A0AAD4QWZ6_9BILA|nr:hypothetical protein DdX_19629 [Ditylenchus destructor]